MKITVSKNQIGSEKHLVFDGVSWLWVDSPDDDSFLWGFDSHRDLRSAAESLRLDIKIFEDTPWHKSQSILVHPDATIMWSKCVPRDKWKKHVQRAVKQLWMNFIDDDNSYYITTYARNREFIQSLREPLVDIGDLKARIKLANENISRSLLKFLPKSGDKCTKFSYSLSKSVTGRMTINQGPNVLTMRKSDRSIFKSRHDNGAIVEIDIVSAEPRVALSLFGKTIQGDVYEDLKNLADLKISRADAKIATLSALYGASHHTIKSRISNPDRSAEILDLVKDYFGVSHIEKMISDQHRELGYIKNTHGRKIFSNPPSLNHFIQSSAVDVSFDIFSSLFKEIRVKKIEAEPVFLIHDAIGIDVKRSDIEELMQICSKGLLSKTIGIKFPVSLKEIK